MWELWSSGDSESGVWSQESGVWSLEGAAFYHMMVKKKAKRGAKRVKRARGEVTEPAEGKVTVMALSKTAAEPSARMMAADLAPEGMFFWTLSGRAGGGSVVHVASVGEVTRTEEQGRAPRTTVMSAVNPVPVRVTA